jgi:BlaI family transcriptional regulator, penicillinase repressor
MARPPASGLTEHELAIMKILWKHPPMTVSDILELWPRNPKPAYTSLLTAVRLMEDKKYLTHTKKGKAFLYSPLLQRSQYRNNQLKRFIGGLFDGNAYELAVNLIKAEELNREEIKNLKKLLEEL